MKSTKPIGLIVVALFSLGLSGSSLNTRDRKLEKYIAPITWAEKLGFPKGKKVIMLHADDIGMCQEANIAAIDYLKSDKIQSAAVMMPCEYAGDMIEWAKKNPNEDIGLHLTLTSEWKTYRWGPV